MQHLVDKHKLGAIAYYYMGEGIPENKNTLSTIISSSLALSPFFLIFNTN